MWYRPSDLKSMVIIYHGYVTTWIRIAGDFDPIEIICLH